MQGKPTEFELASAIGTLWALLKPLLPEEEHGAIYNAHPIVEEIEEYGPSGPVGIGLRRFGGHAVGE